MEELELQLRNLCSSDNRLRLLEAQWEYDKRLVQQALQTVGLSFPHYSLHDSSHSNSILINVTRILGKRILKLSATDIWLFLEAAYWHDVGMVIPDSSLREIWVSEKFQEHLKGLLNSDDSLLSAAALLLQNITSLETYGTDWPIEVKQSLTFVIADFSRGVHAARSAEAVRHPAGFAIESPRTLIPARLFEWLAKICLAHGQNREELSSLPYVENGIGQDHCHPRFVAFLLRLGDLLDLDNGRFCPVLLSFVSKIPPSTSAHIGKHASIESFFVGPERIDVVANCKEINVDDLTLDTSAYRSYKAVSDWFTWMREELTHLAVFWSDIAPENMGSPPSIGKIEARLQGLELISDSEGSNFDIDREYFLQLSKSSGLFGNPKVSWQRELVTNAVDATLLKIWLTSNDEDRKLFLEADDPIAKIYEISKSSPIKISLTALPNIIENGKRRLWAVEISDKGIGIGKEDIKSLQTIGSSSHNKKRQKLLDSLPPFFRPTGSFGLGFQSVFLDTSEVTIETNHFESRVSRKIHMKRPLKKQENMLSYSGLKGGIFVKKLPKNEDLRQVSGSKISFSVEREDTFGKSNQTDPILSDDCLPSDQTWIKEFSETCSSLPVFVSINEKEFGFHQKESAFSYFDKDEAMRITFPLDLPRKTAPFSHLEITYSYRGSKVQKLQGPHFILPYTADMYYGVASEILQVNRNSFTAEGREIFQEKLNRTLPKALRKFVNHLEGLSEATEMLQRSSLLADLDYGEKGLEKHWKELALFQNVNVMTAPPLRIGEILEKDEVCLLVQRETSYFGQLEKKESNLIQDTYVFDMSFKKLISKIFKEKFSEICLLGQIGPHLTPFQTYIDVFVARKNATNGESISEEALKEALIPYTSGRIRMPCSLRFASLAINDQKFDIPFLKGPSMLSPFVTVGDPFKGELEIGIPEIKRYLNYVLLNRIDQNVCKEKIKENTAEFIRFAYPNLLNRKHFRITFNLDNVLREIAEVK